MSLKSVLAVVMLGGAALSASATTYYVAVNGNNKNNGLSPIDKGDGVGPMASITETAKKTVYGDEIVLTKGEYQYDTTGVSIPAGVTLRGETGDPADVIVRNTNHCRLTYEGTFKLNETNATVSSITFTNCYRALVINYTKKDSRAVSGCVVTNCQFVDCVHTDTYFGATHGAGICVWQGGTEIVDCGFTRCSGTGYGGAIYVGQLDLTNAFVTIRNSSFTENQVTNATTKNQWGMGGAIHAESPESNPSGKAMELRNGLIVENCGFTNNYCTYHGAALGGGRLYRVKGCSFVGNHADYAGGVSFQSYAGSSNDKYGITFLPFTNCYFDCTFVSNRTERFGAVYAVHDGVRGNGSACFSNCVFEANVAGGGAVISGNSTATGSLWAHQFYQCAFRRNVGLGSYEVASVPACLIGFVNTTAGVVQGCVFEDNVVTGTCCGVAVANSTKNVVSVEDTIFRNNVCEPDGRTAFKYGGVVYGYSAQDVLELRGCLIVSNVNRACNAIVTLNENDVYSSTTRRVRVVNCTIADNKAVGSESYGVFVYPVENDKTSEIVNSIFYGNGNATNAALANIDFFAKKRVGGNSNFDIYKAISNNLFGVYAKTTGTAATDGDAHHDIVGRDPRFTTVKDVDYRLQGRSPCRGTGAVQDWMPGAVDLAGQPRLSASGKADIGCYAYFPLGLLLFLK